MNDVLHEIRFIPGVIGSFLYLDQQGVAATDLPERYPVPALRQAGRVVSRLFHVHGISCMGVSSVDIAFDDVSLSARKVQEQAAIITLGDSTVNSEFVALTLGSMLGEIQAAVGRIKAADEVPARPSPAAPPKPSARPAATAPPPPAAAPIQSAAEPVRPALQLPRQTLEQLQACLSKALGPVAPLIIGDTLAALQKTHGSTPQELIDRLAGEIDDAELRQTFLWDGRQVVSQLTVADREGAPDTAPPTGPAQAQAEELPEPLLAQVDASLAKAIGPISQLVLGDALAAWQQRGPATQGRFAELVEDLCREIGDATAAAGFRREMEQALKD